MRCSVVFGVTLRLLVINISSSSPAVNAAAYYHRCVITCETVAVHRRPRLQYLPVAAKPDIGSESRFLPTAPAFDAPVGGGFPSEYCYSVWHGKTRMAWLPDGEKNLICLFVLTECTNVTVTQTDRQTPHDDMGRALAYHRAAKTILWELTACSAPNHVRN